MANDLRVSTIQDINGKNIYSQTTNSATIGDSTVSGTSLTLPTVSGGTRTVQNLSIANKLTTSRLRFNTRLQIGNNNRAVMDLGAKTDAILLPKGTTAQRPSAPENGTIRFNTEDGFLDMYVNGGWQKNKYS